MKEASVLGLPSHLQAWGTFPLSQDFTSRLQQGWVQLPSALPALPGHGPPPPLSPRARPTCGPRSWHDISLSQSQGGARAAMVPLAALLLAGDAPASVPGPKENTSASVRAVAAPLVGI